MAIAIGPGWSPVQAAPRNLDAYRIEKMVLARDDGHGRAGEQVRAFKSSDNPLHCVVKLNKGKKGLRVHFRWIVVDGDGVKNLMVLDNVCTVLKPEEVQGIDNQWRRKTAAWPPGKYRVEAFIEGYSRILAVDFLIE